MKKLLFIAAIGIFAACDSKKENESTSATASASAATVASTDASTAASAQSSAVAATSWVESFKAFRDAVYANDKNKTKAYVALPITSGEIWMLAAGGDLNKLPKEGTPFTEADYNKYFSGLFPEDFIKGILKVKTPELEKKGEYTTESYKINNTDNTVTVRKDGNNLTIAVNSSFHAPGAEAEMDGESATIYTFTIDGNNIKLNKVQMAG